MNKIILGLNICAYLLCWLVDQPTKTLWYVGISLPWLSIFAAIPVTILGHVEEKDNWKIWAYIYALATLLYIIVVPMLGGMVFHIMPHLGCCIMAISVVSILHSTKR